MKSETIMRIVCFQPPYPTQGTKASAEDCLLWMRTRLDQLQPGEQDLVLLPEYANAPGLNDRQLQREFAESQGADFLQIVATSAMRLRSLIALAGIIRSGDQWFNRTLITDHMGDLVFSYDKVHLTDVEKKDLGLTLGSMPAVFQYGNIRIGFATCFDLYFPEHFAALAAKRADLVLCPSYQRSESAERIRNIAQIRSLDSGAYLIRSSYAMGEPSIGGRSLISAPDGMLLEDAGANACVIAAELDPKRKFMKPASHGRDIVEHRSLIEAHRRPAVYRPRGERAQQIAKSPFPRLCAHRGLSHACPENTLPAFAAAISVGAHEIEFDLRASRDGVLVVCHNESVDSTTDGTGKVAELDWEDIRRLDAGIRSGIAWRGVRMPRLEEVLDITDGRIGLNIHIKSAGTDGATVRQVCDYLTEHALTNSAYIALETESALQTALEYAPQIPRACLVSQNDPSASIAVAQRYACHRVQFFRDVTQEQIRQARELGLICNLFWSDDPEDGMAFVRNGIDVILTNCAHTMIAGGFDAFNRRASVSGNKKMMICL
jgi:glycerophosphoryl diester phosphodiesterase